MFGFEKFDRKYKWKKIGRKSRWKKEVKENKKKLNSIK